MDTWQGWLPIVTSINTHIERHLPGLVNPIVLVTNINIYIVGHLVGLVTQSDQY